MFVDCWHVECCKCGKLWPEGKGYRAKNVLNEDIPLGWKLGKNWDTDDDYCQDCVRLIPEVDKNQNSCQVLAGETCQSDQSQALIPNGMPKDKQPTD